MIAAIKSWALVKLAKAGIAIGAGFIQRGVRVLVPDEEEERVKSEIAARLVNTKPGEIDWNRMEMYKREARESRGLDGEDGRI